jgi:hypothetical protein
MFCRLQVKVGVLELKVLATEGTMEGFLVDIPHVPMLQKGLTHVGFEGNLM